MSNTNSTATTKTQFPATKALVQAILAECAAKGYEVVSLDPTTESGVQENRGYCFIRLSGTHAEGASLIVPKATGTVKVLHSHVDLSGLDGYIPLAKPNGRVICHFSADPKKVAAALPSFLSATKRATQRPTPKATPATTPAEPVGDVFGAALEAMLADSRSDSTETAAATVDPLPGSDEEESAILAMMAE